MDGFDAGELLELVLNHYGVPVRTGNVRCPLPDHGDRVASMSVNVNKGAWHCHGCGKSGYATHFVMGMEGINYRQARELAASLADAAGVTGRGGSKIRATHQRRDDNLPWSAGADTDGRQWVAPWRRE